MAELKNKPNTLSRDDFVSLFGGVYEHSPWVAEQVFDAGLDESFNDADVLAAAMAKVVALQDEQTKLDLINAHPDLAGKAAVRGELTASSTSEQARAGLNECSHEEFEKFQTYNAAYKDKFGFPFIKAVRNSNRFEILKGFENRLENDQATEFETALAEIDKIAAFRLQDL
ncbi:2-oxo-4-hydroxy-4-carboxy-5-ureidoimidazoline decarboxylase [Sneathiella sp. P13V-1]|uniref:2-oxo-4-hydroxy-4-carboxy-5-ureidoimidazoline decarboxylase n=1 Tax=Sneathiella sp. P13V-1 TaxID=2697366 RepID=UPI00187B74B5|nr:2-oxo-4-hydroxy-4-carboxy-5-ureidoimidazoline decarboxylase [Sneathiella sp. P13V-1]MBE7638153.1 2-oxo-4-hydroxy-4-carboxy-5-ureidoimidazoline decarboxylase [Sneathiella sp. P13V-1]